MKYAILIIIFLQVQVSNPIARDDVLRRGENLAIFEIREPVLGYGEHSFAIQDVVHFPYVGTTSMPAFKINLKESEFKHWSGRIKDLPVPQLKMRAHIINLVNESKMLRCRESDEFWNLENLVLWRVAEDKNHFVWVASFAHEKEKVGYSHQTVVSVFFHLDGRLVIPRCVSEINSDHDPRMFHWTFDEAAILKGVNNGSGLFYGLNN